MTQAKKNCLATFLVCLFNTPVALYAQNIEQQQRQIIQQQAEQLNRIKERADSSLTRRIKPNKKPAILALEKVFQDNLKIPINRLDIEGNTLLKLTFLSSLRVKYENRELTAAEVRNIIRDVTNQYIDMGYVTARVFLPPQNIASGSLKIKIIEGTVESYTLENTESKINTKNIFPYSIGNPLNLRYLEQGFDQINRLQSNNATMDIRPGLAQGGSDILLKNQPTKEWFVLVDINNYGLENTGEWQHYTTISHDNLFSHNDLLTLTYGYDPSFSGDGNFNELGSILFSVPHGNTLLKFSGNFSSYVNYQTNSGIEIRSTGRSKGFSVEVDQLLYRDQTSKVFAHWGLDYKNSKNFLNETFLSINSRQTASTTLGISAITSLNEGRTQLYGNASLTHGLPLFGAPSTFDLINISPRYTKANFYGSLTHYLKDEKYRVAVQNTLQWQHTSNKLFSTEQMNLGGRSSIRGFKNESISAMNAISLSQEVFITFNDIPFLPNIRLNLLQPYIAIDSGFAYKTDNIHTNGLISGVTFGAKARLNKLSAELSLSKGLVAPEAVQIENAIAGISISYSF